MIIDVIGKRYAEAIYEVAEEKGKVMELYEDLKKVLAVYETDTDFKNFSEHPRITIAQKEEAINKIFKGELDEFSFKILDYVIEKDRFIYLGSILKEYLKLYYEKNKVIEVKAILAVEPTEEQKATLRGNIEKNTGKKVELQVEIDTSILGGGIIKIGNKVIDGSIKRQFEMLKQFYNV